MDISRRDTIKKVLGAAAVVSVAPSMSLSQTSDNTPGVLFVDARCVDMHQFVEALDGSPVFGGWRVMALYPGGDMTIHDLILTSNDLKDVHLVSNGKPHTGESNG